MEQKLQELFLEIGKRKKWPEYYENSVILSSKIECYAEKLMNVYDPAPMWNFQLYLLNWLDNVKTIKEKFLLLNSLSYFAFFNREQCNALYLEALHGPIKKWLIDIKDLNILDEDIDEILSEKIESTFISAATDSTDISTMHHICGFPMKHTYIWYSFINPTDDENEIKRKIDSCKNDLHEWKYEQIVIIEDFVGSGTQSIEVIDFLGNFPEWKILFIPLLICPQGDMAITKHLYTKEYNHIIYEPISKMPWELILAEKRPHGSNCLPNLLDDFRKYARKIYTKVMGTKISGSKGYLGYKETGALFAKYTNCPDNTLPLYNEKENKYWKPLFPRSAR
jgi:hypothetical protein